MDTFRVYVNYGCLAAEKRNIYTHSAPEATATCSDEIECAVPEGWEMQENYMGQKIMISPFGETYKIDQLLDGKEEPYFSYIEGGEKRIKLTVVSGEYVK